MTDPTWIATARSLIGQVTDGPSILPLANKVGELYPEMTAYFHQVKPDTAWCGLFVAYCLAVNGIRPQYIQDNSDTNDGLWAQSWKLFGSPASAPQVGDILVFARHVTFYVGEDGNNYLCLGGNQADSVKISSYSKSSCEAIRRVPDQALQAPAGAFGRTKLPSGNRFEECLAVTLRWEGGNDDDPRDPGGRTSRGILQSEWDLWRQSHGNLPYDVWDAPQDQIEAIYRQKYWDRMLCDQMSAGVDLVVFDFGVNSGGGVKVVQRVVGTDPDGEVGPLTLAALAAAPAEQLIDRICDARLAYLQGLAIWPTFGRGWTNRVNDVRAKAHTMISEEPTPVAKADPSPLPQTVPQASNPTNDMLRQAMEFGLEIAKKEMAKPENQAAVKGLIATALPKLLGTLGVSVPGIGIVVAVAGYVVPLLLDHGFTADTAGPALMAAGGGLAGIPVLGALIDRLKGRIGVQ